MIIEIHGIKINFPFEPYPLQKDYMTKVIEALQSQQNAVLESPTGTGKTLCLLTSSLAWLLQQKDQTFNNEKSYFNQQASDVMKNMKSFDFKPEEVAALFDPTTDGRRWKVSTIIYTSRTHSQLTQAMRELKNSDYNDIEAVAIGSRDQLCINSEVLNEGKSSGERNNLCQLKVKKRQCKYREQVDKCAVNPEVLNMPVKDIEDLVNIGRNCSACPYYLSRELASNADIIFMPYNYLLDPRILKSFKINLNDSVIILDEAHNVEKVCEESASIQFASSDITNCINDIAHVMKMLDKEEDLLEFIDTEDAEKDFTIEDLAKLQEVMLSLEKEIDKIDSVMAKQGRTFPGSKIFEIFRAASIDNISYPMIRKLIDSVAMFLTQSSAGNLFGRKGGGLTKFMQVLETVFDGCGEGDFDKYISDMERGYRVHVELEAEKKKQDSGGGWLSSQTKLMGNPKVINYWCFNPGYGMANLLKRQVRSVILTSGTLAPLKPLISELAIDIDHRLENPHIVKPSQVLVKIVNVGPDKEPLCGTYDNRDNPKYIKSMGLTLIGISRVTPNGMLVFFPSYPMMNKCFETWQNTGIWQTLYEIKPILLEPRGKDEFQERINEYYGLVKLKKGAIFMAVLRGKISEGLDFNDHNARAVVICGIPFPPLLDPRVVLKKKYLDINRNAVNQLQTGQEWYVLEAVRAVNQAIGRVIRHKDDYGAIFLCDKRFHQQKMQLSKWIQPQLMKQSPSDVNFGAIVGDLARFFRNLSTTMPEPAVREDNKKENYESNAQNMTSTTITSHYFVKQQIKLENPNEIYSSSSKSNMQSEDFTKYVNDMQQKVKKEPEGFMGSLNREVSVIDFNSTSSNEASSSSSLKAARLNDVSQENENASKKRRLKMIPNANQLYSEPQKSVLNQVRSTKVRVSKNDYDRVVPTDKKGFLFDLKSNIPSEAYKIYLSALYYYNKKEYTIEKTLDKFIVLFKTSPKTIAFLRHTRNFLREEDRLLLDSAIENNFVVD